MPSIAQQDYIYIPILDGGEMMEEIPQEIQNRLVQLAMDGRALDVVFCEANSTPKNFLRPFHISATPEAKGATYFYYDTADNEMAFIECTYREITNEPDAQEENHADAQ